MADLGWSDCGRKTASQNFYPRKGRIGKKMVGGCGNFEAKGALYAARLSKRWAALFLLKNGREPSDGETFFAFRTGQAARDVKSWEKMPLATFVEDKKPGKINISHNGESYANILQKWLDDRRAKEDAEKQRLIQEEEDAKERILRGERRAEILRNSEVPRSLLIRISNDEPHVRDAALLLYDVTEARLDELVAVLKS